MKRSAAYTASMVATALLAGVAYALVPRRQRLQAGSVVVVTGGSRGLGLAIARRFGKGGMKLVLAARTQSELEEARHALLHEGCVQDEDDVLLVACDLSDAAQCAGLIEQTVRAFGRVDCVVNNAGVIQVGPVEDQPLATYAQTMEINFYAALRTCYAAMPHMLAQGSGSLVNIASIGGKMPVPHLAPYVAAKFALVGFSETLHSELRAKGVRVTTVCPGLMRTGGEDHAHFSGDVAAEKKWFDWAAKTALVAVTPEYAAERIYRATQAGRAEITISPQAWLAARGFGLMPESFQAINALVNEHVLPPATAQETGADPSPS